MRAWLLLLATCIMWQHGTHAQIKTGGIKTHYPPQNSGSLVLDNYNSTQGSSYYYNNNNNNNNYNYSFVPAETYPGGSGSGPYVPRPPIVRPPEVFDATAEFINKTREGMASGVCYTEVPTSTLVHDRGMVPVGNGTTPNMSKIQICCNGYERNPHVYARCDPICKDDCPNGICTAPNTCVCIPGHVRNNEGKCISTCPLGCGNGVCNAYNECECKPGFKLDPVSRKYCEPYCERGCQYGVCVAPNKCDCHADYQLTASGACEPKCDNCANGRCTAPGICSCNTGYMKVTGACEPVCALGCNKGRCIAPDTCECSAGFKLDRTGSVCEAHCDQPCLNGVCDGANSCTCNPGYVPDDFQRNVCKPNCPQGCPNGYCTAPNFCVCKPGYVKSGIKGRQTCIPVQ